MGQPVVHFEVVGKDIDKLKDFYSELAGWTYDQPPEATQEGVPPYALVQRNSDSEIGGGIGVGPEGYEGHVTFYIEVPDVGLPRSGREAGRYPRDGPGLTGGGPDDRPLHRPRGPPCRPDAGAQLAVPAPQALVGRVAPNFNLEARREARVDASINRVAPRLCRGAPSHKQDPPA
jgi:hypothetical protein